MPEAKGHVTVDVAPMQKSGRCNKIQGELLKPAGIETVFNKRSDTVDIRDTYGRYVRILNSRQDVAHGFRFPYFQQIRKPIDGHSA